MILAARLALNFAMAAFSDPVDPNAKFKLKFSSRLFVRRVGICREMQERRADEVLVLDGEA